MDSNELTQLLLLLEKAKNLNSASQEFLRLERAVSHLEKSAKKKRKLQRKKTSKSQDANFLAQHSLQKFESEPAHLELNRERRCYVCKKSYRLLHEWYPQLCRDCGTHSLAMRHQPLDVSGRHALVTGGRIKIGFATALSLLKNGAEVHVTTRYPKDALLRFQNVPNSSSWISRLHLHGLDFRNLNQLISTLNSWADGPAFDIVINNAAQSVWRSRSEVESLQKSEGHGDSTGLSLLGNVSLNQIDLHRVDSWRQTLGEIAPLDLVEVQVVNAIAPFLICNCLRKNILKSSFSTRFIVNVSAVEGQFERAEKSVKHPHTNMAKAGLNMLTRTSASDFALDNIYMNSVDPGRMSREGPFEKQNLMTPLDAEDCAARILFPISRGLSGFLMSGMLLKDFQEVPW